MRIALFLVLLLLIIPTVLVFADEDEFEEEEESKFEFGEREGDDEGSEKRLGGIASIILYITIAAVAGTGGYVLWKIASMKKVKRI